jgi:hypothetical protein
MYDLETVVFKQLHCKQKYIKIKYRREARTYDWENYVSELISIEMLLVIFCAFLGQRKRDCFFASLKRT